MSALPSIPDPVTAVRQCILSGGYQPIAVYNWNAKTDGPGKRPYGDGWEKTRGMPPFVPSALNTGILASNLRVIDIDLDDDRADTAVALTEEVLGRSPLVRFRNNSKRRLLVYRGNGRKRMVCVGKKRQIEILGDGQQFVAFGRHHTGAEIEWEDASPADFARNDLPEATEEKIERLLLAYCEEFGFTVAGRGDDPQAAQDALGSPPASGAPIVRPTTSTPVGDTLDQRWAHATLNGEVKNVAACPEGGRNDTLNTSAMKLGQLVAGGYLNEGEVVQALRNAAITCGLVKDDGWASVNATICSGLEFGKTQPRVRRDMPAIEVPADVVEAAQGMASRSAARPAPKALEIKVAPSKPYPLDALGNVLGPAAKAIAAKIQCAPSMAAQSVLSVASLGAQAIADVRLPYGHIRPLSLFGLTIAASGDRKSGADAEAMISGQDARGPIAGNLRANQSGLSRQPLCLERSEKSD